MFLHAQKDMNVGILNNKAEQIGASSHRQVNRNITSVCMGYTAEFSALGRMHSTFGTYAISTGQTNPIVPVSGAFFQTGGTIETPFESFLRDTQEHRSVRPGSIVFNSASDVALQAGEEITIGASASISATAVETVSMAAQEDIRMTSGQSMTQYAKDNIAIAADGAILLRTRNAELSLSPDGEIRLTGTKIIMNGDKICLN
ncbi:MAG: DUF2345 domain-containing protein [Rhodobacteraceae bacterium]|nr:MAG: DUF2345 domain-containing protein [Paracoccaceae bacterium]